MGGGGGGTAVSGEDVGRVLICLPNRPPEDAWSEVVAAVKGLARGECREATGGQHIGEFRWSADFEDVDWTLLLLPVYMTYYVGDGGGAVCVVGEWTDGTVEWVF